MDCQYEYAFVGPSDHHGFLPHHPIEYIDPLAEKRIKIPLRISDCGIRNQKYEIGTNVISISKWYRKEYPLRPLLSTVDHFGCRLLFSSFFLFSPDSSPQWIEEWPAP